MTTKENDSSGLFERTYEASVSLWNTLKSTFSSESPEDEYVQVRKVLSKRSKGKYKLDDLEILHDRDGNFTSHWVSGYNKDPTNIDYSLNQLGKGTFFLYSKKHVRYKNHQNHKNHSNFWMFFL